ncbi:hypothetical protein, partial [Candidatus Bathycorpusculum sp.]|uniref:hypothetical protein n=1 Tax=Candidatus Bathycorpusculum sp. TaxID=2994959 RepID=UPI00282B89CD|nr:hypothetical protein [Candidatus Termitimicrobium sp.]
VLSPVVSCVPLVGKAKVGYVLAADPYTPRLPTTITETNKVIKVFYVPDSIQAKTLSYTVEYYKDNVKVSGDTKIVTEIVWVNAPNALAVVSVDTSNTKYAGYRFDHTNPSPIPVSIVDGSVIKVYYVREATDETIVLTGLSWNNGNGNGNGGGINQFSVNGIALKNNKNCVTSGSFDTAVKQAPVKNGETAIYSVDERSVQNSFGAYEKVYYVRVALFDSATGVWKVYAGTVSVNNPGGNDKNQQVVLTKIS